MRIKHSKGKGISRRSVLTGIAGVSVPMLVGAKFARADQQLTITSWGGSYRAAAEKAFVTPFQQATGVKVTIVDNADLARVKAQVESKNVTWDVVDLLGPQITGGAKDGLWEPLDSAVTATGNYSYVAKRSVGRNYLMLGDAYTFIDPVFSTGVLLAMQSAFAGADTIQTCLDQPRKAGAALKRFDAMMRRGPGIFSWLIYRVTTPAIRDLFMAPSEKFGLQGSIISVLAGDIYRQTPWRRGLRLFQVIYYLKSLSSLRQSVSAWFRRRRAIQSV